VSLSIDVLPLRIRVLSAEGEHAYFCDDERGRDLLRRRNARLIRRRDGRIRALQLLEPESERHGGREGFGRWRTVHKRETADNPQGVWTHSRDLLTSGHAGIR